MDIFKKILTFDTSVSACSAALFDHNGNGTIIKEDMPRGQSEALMPMIEDVLERSQCSYEDVDCIVTTIGPGAFTGLRIGLSVAKALGLSLNKPVFGVSTLQAIAFEASESAKGDFKVLVETRRDDFYIQDFSMEGFPISEPQALSADDIERKMADVKCITGDAVDRFLKLAKHEEWDVFTSVQSPDPLIMAEKLLVVPELFTPNVEPLYLRGADVSQSKKQYRVLEG